MIALKSGGFKAYVMHNNFELILSSFIIPNFDSVTFIAMKLTKIIGCSFFAQSMWSLWGGNSFIWSFMSIINLLLKGYLA